MSFRNKNIFFCSLLLILNACKNPTYESVSEHFYEITMKDSLNFYVGGGDNGGDQGDPVSELYLRTVVEDPYLGFYRLKETVKNRTKTFKPIAIGETKIVIKTNVECLHCIFPPYDYVSISTYYVVITE